MFREIGKMLAELQIENDKLKAENEELKQHQEKVFENWSNITNAQKALIKDLQQKIKELIKDETKEKLLVALEDIQGLTADRNNWKNHNSYLHTQNLKLKQTLTEIKEIVQFGFRPYKVCGEHNNCCDVLNEIWNKISECEVENDFK